MTIIALAVVFSLTTPYFARQTYPVFSDASYDQGDAPLTGTACSYGLITRGYNTFEDLPRYPYIGGAPQINGLDSPNCSTCWLFQYTDPAGKVNTFDYTAIDVGEANPAGFTISVKGLDFLTGGNAESLNGTSVTVSSQEERFCFPSESR